MAYTICYTSDMETATNNTTGSTTMKDETTVRNYCFYERPNATKDHPYYPKQSAGNNRKLEVAKKFYNAKTYKKIMDAMNSVSQVNDEGRPLEAAEMYARCDQAAVDYMMTISRDEDRAKHENYWFGETGLYERMEARLAATV
jgi:hypothetical protein